MYSFDCTGPKNTKYNNYASFSGPRMCCVVIRRVLGRNWRSAISAIRLKPRPRFHELGMERPMTGGRWSIKVVWQRSKGMGSGPVLGKTVLHSGLMCRSLHNCVTSDRPPIVADSEN
ncbi:hypothetical protein IG631_23518 [Alternaria alternata]|nr:hypothetical protein IG631_23518 [Alternaria alternata]